MKARHFWLPVGLGVVAVLLAPVWILWCPGAHAWRDHAYRTLLYARIAQHVMPASASVDEEIDRAAEYVQTHLWTPSNSIPYDGKPLDYLVTGVGWCDYLAKTFVNLLGVRGIPSRYAMLLQANGNSPHTVAEVQTGGRWGAYDVLFGVRFLNNGNGRSMTLEELSAAPHALEQQPALIALRGALPEKAEIIQQVYASVLPLAIPPRRSRPGTSNLTPFDHVLLTYARWGGPRFTAWYQDRYLAATGLALASTPAETLRLARHWHLAGRTTLAKHAYKRCAADRVDSTVATESQFWLGLLEWELEGEAETALRTFANLTTQSPRDRWAPVAWYYMGRCEEALGHPTEAQAWYQAAAASDFASAWPRLVRLQHAAHQPRGATPS